MYMLYAKSNIFVFHTMRVNPSHNSLGPVVQCIISLMSSLRGQLIKCFTTLLPNKLIFVPEKMREAFAPQSFSYFINKRYWHVKGITV